MRLCGAYITPPNTETDYQWRSVYEYHGLADAKVEEWFKCRTVMLSDVKLYPEDKSMPVLLMKGKVKAEPDVSGRYQRILKRKD